MDRFTDIFPLRRGRVHEACGASAYSFAFALAAQHKGAILWIKEKWQADQLNPSGLADFISPSEILVAQGKDQPEVLASAEEALRSGAVSLTLLELSKPLSLIAGRRLQLAAEAGQSTGLCLIQDGMGSNAAETRWQCEPLFGGADSTLQRWGIIKNKTGTLTSWDVRWDAKTRRVIVVSKTGE